MEYLIINGSPHKGNTWKIVECALEVISKKDKNASFFEIHLAEENIPFCMGCSNCFRKGIEFCPHKEAVEKILKAMEVADGIIVASTTFNMRETALLKNMFDHFCFMMHRPHFFTKKAMVITSVGGMGGKSAAKGIAATLKAIGVNRCYQFAVRTVSWNAYEPSESMKFKLKKVTENFCIDVMSNRLHVPSTELLIPFNIFRGMSVYYVPGTKFETQDGIYYMDALRKNRVYDARVPVRFYQKALGFLFYQIGKIAGRRMIVTYKKSDKSLLFK